MCGVRSGGGKYGESALQVHRMQQKETPSHYPPHAWTRISKVQLTEHIRRYLQSTTCRFVRLNVSQVVFCQTHLQIWLLTSRQCSQFTSTNMDSMRNLRTSLPSTSRRQASQPPEDLIQAFKQAALSVTALYKTAGAEQARAYQEGYQDVLEELLRFLDKENLGLQDGEGWRVRQWATERYQGSSQQAQGTSDNEEEAEYETRARSSSPISQRKDVVDNVQAQAAVPTPAPPPAPPPAPSPAENTPGTEIPSRPLTAPPTVPNPSESPTRSSINNFTIPSSDFTFRSSAFQTPSTHDIDMTNEEPNTNNTSANGHTLQVNLFPRQPRSSRPNNRPSNRSLGPGAGSKRNFPLIDFFDIGGFNGKDGSQGGGGKRARPS